MDEEPKKIIIEIDIEVLLDVLMSGRNDFMEAACEEWESDADLK